MSPDVRLGSGGGGVGGGGVGGGGGGGCAFTSTLEANEKGAFRQAASHTGRTWRVETI